MNIMLPTDDKFIEHIAKSIGRDRMFREASELLQSTMGIRLPDNDDINDRFDREFNILWDSTEEECVQNKGNYIKDAILVINKINLFLLTNTVM